MKITLKVVNSIVEKKKYVDQKTGNAKERFVATVGGSLDSGEMVSCVLYGDFEEDFKNLPKSGAVVLDCYKYESQNALMGSLWARSFTPTR